MSDVLTDAAMRYLSVIEGMADRVALAHALSKSPVVKGILGGALRDAQAQIRAATDAVEHANASDAMQRAVTLERAAMAEADETWILACGQPVAGEDGAVTVCGRPLGHGGDCV